MEGNFQENNVQPQQPLRATEPDSQTLVAPEPTSAFEKYAIESFKRASAFETYAIHMLGYIVPMQRSIDDLCESVIFIANNMATKDELREILTEYPKTSELDERFKKSKEDLAQTEFRIKVYVDKSIVANFARAL